MKKIRLEQLKVRAYENMVEIVTVNYAIMEENLQHIVL